MPGPSGAQTRSSCAQSGKPRPKKEALESIQKNEFDTRKDNRVVPAHSVKDYYNAVVGSVPGSVHGMKVFF